MRIVEVLAVAIAVLAGALAAAAAPAAWRVRPRHPEQHGLGQPGTNATVPASALVGLTAAGTTAGALVTVWVGWRPALPAMLVAVLASIWLAAVDLRVHRLPAGVVYLATGTVGLLLAAAATAGQDSGRLAAAAIGAVAMWSVYYVAGLVGVVGVGDRRFAGLLGAVAGWAGLDGWAVAALLPFAVVAAVGGVGLVSGRRTRGQAMPFGPAMALGLLTAIGFAY